MVVDKELNVDAAQVDFNATTPKVVFANKSFAIHHSQPANQLVFPLLFHNVEFKVTTAEIQLVVDNAVPLKNAVSDNVSTKSVFHKTSAQGSELSMLSPTLLLKFQDNAELSTMDAETN